VAAAVGVAAGFCAAVHLLTPLGEEAIQPLAAQLQQLVALAVAQLVGTDQRIGTVAIASDAVEGEPCPPSG
jgi:hypothetical protein